jgi:hypothetical protein
VPAVLGESAGQMDPRPWGLSSCVQAINVTYKILCACDRVWYSCRRGVVEALNPSATAIKLLRGVCC